MVNSLNLIERFRAKNLNESLIMFQKIINPKNYLFITFRENDYLITGVLLVLALVTYFSNTFLEPKLNQFKCASFCFHTLKYTIIIIFVFTFLRPISQFIYFQF